MTIYSENITPDSFSGALFAVEGIAGACTVLNGPTGCKFYHSAISESQLPRGPAGNPLSSALGEFWFGMPRIPSTYLDGNDYVFSSRDKLERLLRSLGGGRFGLVGVINSPGAALIGDDVERLLAETVRGVPAFALETTGFSTTFGSGYQKALGLAVDVLGKKGGGARPKTVNLLGLGIYQKYFEGNYAALKRLLALCGIEVLSAPGAGDPSGAFARIAEAEINIAVYPEYSLHLAEKLRAGYGTPFLSPKEGPPIGFDSTESFVREVSAALGADPAPALAAVEAARARAYRYLLPVTAALCDPRGALFSVSAEASTAYALVKWLVSYLGMIPASVSPAVEEETPFSGALKDYLASIDRAEALERPMLETPAPIVFADGNTIAALRLAGRRCCGVEISLPTLNYLDLTEKSLLGGEGALFLLEQVINGLRYAAG
ncbi:MAG: nitrogenase component 1 [Treponema sp.]|jgi:nitrogenase molybdenum-iron protein alpha/beta subunit|nr:nitrogenase component 1 [Treponema sp.]